MKIIANLASGIFLAIVSLMAGRYLVFPPHVTIQSPKCKTRCRRSDKYLQLSADCKNIVNSSSAMLTGREVAGKLVQY